MTSFSIKHNSKEIQEQFKTLPERVGRAAHSAGAAIAQALAERIRSMIPDQGGWFDIYRQSINFIEINPSEWGIAGVAELEFDQVEADASLLWFQGGDDVAQLLSPYNPWTVDTLPSVKDGITSDVLVRPASAGEVDHHRTRLKAQLPSIGLLLQRIGAQLQPNGLPKVDGRIMADLDFLTRRLEFGLGGFPRTPIWAKAEGEIQKIADSPPISNKFKKNLEE
jgi:hypothetical protein